MKKVKWAVLGSCGIAKRRTIPEGIVAADNAELVAVYDLNTVANEELAKEFGVKAVGGEAELLTTEADVIYIATPANLHFEQVQACAKAGKHVLCEKPLGMTNEEAEKMIAACNGAGVKLGIGFMMRFLAQHQAAAKLIADGKLGQPVYGRAQLSCWYPPMEGAWRQNPAQGGGGSLIDMGGHCIDLMEMFFGEVKKVSCFTNNSVHDYKTEDSAVAMLSFENGAIATVDTFFCIPDASSKTRLELYGSKGSILAEGTIGQGEAGGMVAYLEEDVAGYDGLQNTGGGEGAVIAPEPVNMYRSEVEEFSASILENRSSALGAETGLRSQKVLSACYESARTGQAIEI
ncbi:MAG: Gfo/Idh/MocA family oxidoreductase, partial [Verrucomicrobiota bacterium]